LLPGQVPAQEARCAAVGKVLRSASVSPGAKLDAGHRALVFGGGDDPINFVSARDVAAVIDQVSSTARLLTGPITCHLDGIDQRHRLASWYADMSRSYHLGRDSYPLFTGEGVNQPSGNDSASEITEIKNRGHALTIDNGWREVAETASPSSNGSHNSAPSVGVDSVE
jgi:hypothetical protein